jgi:hypothetical protein
MAQQKDLLGRLAEVGEEAKAKLTEAGEEAKAKLAEVPGSKRVIDVASGLRGRIDELQKRLRILDPLERRVTALEKKLAALEKQGSTTGTRRASAAKTAAKRPAAAKKSTPKN